MIETSRLFIDLISLEDCEDVRVLHNHPETLRWLSDTHEVSREEQMTWFQALQQSKTSRRYVARTKVDQYLVGVFRFDRHDSINQSAEVGLDVDFNMRRKGFAREIYTAMIPVLFNELSINRISLVTLETNKPAINLYENLGFKREGRLRQAFYRYPNFVDAYQYSLLSSEIKT